MMMQIRDDDLPWPADPQREAATLDSLRAEFPALRITTSYYGTGRAWLGRGIDGHPWLGVSGNLARFGAMMRGYWPC